MILERDLGRKEMSGFLDENDSLEKLDDLEKDIIKMHEKLEKRKGKIFRMQGEKEHKEKVLGIELLVKQGEHI